MGSITAIWKQADWGVGRSARELPYRGEGESISDMPDETRLLILPWPRYSSIEPEDICVRIRSTQMKVGDDLRCNDAKRDAIAAVAERKIGMGTSGVLPMYAKPSFVSPNVPAHVYATSMSSRGNMLAKRRCSFLVFLAIS